LDTLIAFNNCLPSFVVLMCARGEISTMFLKMVGDFDKFVYGID